LLVLALLCAGAWAAPGGERSTVPAGGRAPERVPAACRLDDPAAPVVPDPSESLEDSILALSERGCSAISGRRFDRARVTGELARLSGRVATVLGDDREPHRALAAIGRVLFIEERYAYDASGTDPDLYMLDRVIDRKRGNCLGLTLLYDLIGERIGLPLTGSYLPGHIFVRYDRDGVRINVETSRAGAELSDAEYRRVFRMGKDRPYMHTLNRKALAAVFIKTVGASCACARKDEAALLLYEEAKRLYPELADIHFNTGLSLERTGQPAAASDAYRQCLSFDPGLTIAREKLDRPGKGETEACGSPPGPPAAGSVGPPAGR
jgi:tetratricopeptide (TPR) repeat protein